MTARRPKKRATRPSPDSNASLGGRSDEETGMDFSSLIDVSFLLLIFFIATSTLQPRESEIGMTLPCGRPGFFKVEPFRIELTADGRVFANDELLESDVTQRELPNLRNRLELIRALADATGDKNVFVSFSAEDGARGQRFLDVMNCLATTKILNVAFTFPPNL